MLTNQSLKDALLVVGHYKKELHNKMLTVVIDELCELRTQIDGFTKLEIRIKNELKNENSVFLNELNKEQ
ncbi:hypothetical protein [Salmonella enterica]|uniref:hypothetical protein n=1 Tax=Salmonella enterica TaxID=28901 RepID=UPI0031675D74